MSTVTQNRPSSRSIYVNALVGAVATFVLSWLPLSPVLGGAVAGYLQGPDTSRGLRAGALAGGIAAIPGLLGVAAVGTFVLGIPVLGAVGGGSGSLLGFGLGIVGILLVLALLLVIVLGYFVALSAAGGYLGSVVADR
jgi:hypothetical protein